MSRRNEEGKFAKAPSKKLLLASWLSTGFTFALLWFATKAVWANLSSFRSCESSNNGVTLASCGKQGLNFGDLVLIGLFILVVCMAYSVSIHTYRISKRMLK